MKKLLKNRVFLVIVAIVVVAAGYFEYRNITAGNSAAPSYVTAKAERGTLVVSVNGSGQISASDQIDIKPKVSGDITWVGVKGGDAVGFGQSLVKIDSTDAQGAVISVEQALATSKLQYQKDEAQAPIDYQKAIDALNSAKENLDTQYNSTFNALSTTYLDLPDIMTGTENILYGTDLSPKNGQWNADALVNLFSDKDPSKIAALANNGKSDYSTASNKYDQGTLAYKQANRSSSGDELKILLTQSIDVTTAVAQALQSELNLLGAVSDLGQQYNRSLPAAVKTLQASARSYLSSINSDLSTLLSQKTAIDSDKQFITADEQNITLLKVGNINGDNPISLQISKNNIATQEQNLADLRNKLSDYTIVAPFSGVISTVNVRVGDTTSGSTVATIVSNKQLAEATFNEVDIVNIKINQKATITFDALPNLTLTGKIAEIDTVGTVSQGVVSYKVTIALDTLNDSVKPGMSDTVSIITNVKPDVILVPNSAVTTRQKNSYVQVLGADGKPVQTQVTVGVSNDTTTEIVSGLKEGDTVVTQTITSTTAAATQQSSGLRLPGLGGVGR